MWTAAVDPASAKVRLAVGLVALVAMLAVSDEASGESANGAQVLRQHGCFSNEDAEDPEQYVFCVDATFVLTTTESASGNVSYTVHRTSTGGYLFGDCLTTDFKYVNTAHYLMTDGELHEGTLIQRQVLTYPACYPLPAQECTYETHFHYVDGVYQFDRFAVECTPVDGEEAVAST
jgi:hypothetical protein